MRRREAGLMRSPFAIKLWAGKRAKPPETIMPVKLKFQTKGNHQANFNSKEKGSNLQDGAGFLE
jgi:hypothetical protein